MRYLLDTNVVSEPTLARPRRSGIAWLEVNVERCSIASVTWHELWYGVEILPHGRMRERLASYLERVVRPTYRALAYGQTEADWHAIERGRLIAAGRTPAFVDGQVAATAQVNGYSLVTANVRDFAHFRGLKVLSWAEICS